MGQVRKDILNGWKEIGGYVSRDIRTVERWEKQRGLPVRRMPGAGRATVYALISELDEWLENTGPEPPPDIGPPPETPASHPAAANGFSGASAFGTQVATVATENSASFSTLYGISDRTGSQPHQPVGPAGRRRLPLTALGLALGAALVFASPIIRGHSRPIASSVPVTAAQVEQRPAAPYRSRVPGVDDLYLRGVYSYEQRTPDSLQRSLEEFAAASAKDPTYAPAYAGLANTYNLLREYSVMPDAEAYPKARQAAEHAIALDPRLPEAHAALGFIEFFWSWNAAGAEHEFRTALALDPNSVVAHHWYGSMLMHQGRFAEAIEQLDIAQRLQPNSAAILSTRALAMGLAGHRREAVDMMQDVIRATPGASSPHAILADLSNIEPRDPARYLAEMRRCAELRHDSEMLQVNFAATSAYRSGDERQMWTAILATEERLHPGVVHRTYLMAEAEAALGQKDQALTDLEHLAVRHDAALVGMEIDTLLIPLHSDHRFADLVATVGLPATKK